MIPEGWGSNSLTDLVEGCDYGLSCGLSADPKGVPILRMGNLQGGRLSLGNLKYVPESQVQERDILRRSDILLNRTNSLDLVGKVALFDSEQRMTFASYLFRLRTLSHVDPAWLAHVLTSAAYQSLLRSIATPGVSQANINRQKLLALPVLSPPLGEQKRIAAILSSVDEAIESTQAVIEQLQVVKKAMMADLLTRGLPGRHNKFKATDIGDVPEGWDVRPIGELVHACDYGLSKPLNRNDRGIAVLRMPNLMDGLVSMEDLKFVTAAEVPDGLLLEAGDVLFNRTNSKDLVGKVGLFQGASRSVSFASYLLRLRPERERVVGAWLATAMNLNVNQELLRAMATPGVSQVNINRGKMLALQIAVPSLEEQQAIIQVLSQMDDRLGCERAVLQEQQSLKAALASALLTGELRVTPEEAP